MYPAAGQRLYAGSGQAARTHSEEITMPDLNPQPLPPLEIRVTAPARLLNNLEEFQKVQASVLSEAGCPGCHSGLRLIWQDFQQYEVSQDGAVRGITGVISAGGGAQFGEG
jgi:hypothetical protein